MNFNAKRETEKIIEFIKDYFNKYKLDGIVIGISGGKDSTVVSALFAKAIGAENIIGITMPCNSIKQDEEDAQKVANHVGFKLYHVDLKEIFEVQFTELNKTFNINPKKAKEAAINLKPRLRMSSLYYITQGLNLQNNKNYIVAGTSNKCEIYIGYFTKWGDAASDLNILGDFTVSEVIAIADELGLPKDLVYKAPADGLSGKTDEERLGFTYKEVERVINGEITHEKIEKMHQATFHKFAPVTYKREK